MPASLYVFDPYIDRYVLIVYYLKCIYCILCGRYTSDQLSKQKHDQLEWFYFLKRPHFVEISTPDSK